MPRTFEYHTVITWRDGTENTIRHPFLEEGSVVARVGLKGGKEPSRMVTYRILKAPEVEGWINAFAYETHLRFEVEFNAAGWMASASEEEIVALARYYWCGCTTADAATLYARDYDLDVARFLMLVEEAAKSGIYTEINETSAMAWIETYRPAVAQTLKEALYGAAGRP